MYGFTGETNLLPKNPVKLLFTQILPCVIAVMFTSYFSHTFGTFTTLHELHGQECGGGGGGGGGVFGMHCN